MLPADERSRSTLYKSTGKTHVIPLDEYLATDNLPFKMTIGMMLNVAFWAQNQSSYKRTEAILSQLYKVRVNDDTVRAVANYIGRIVFSEDCRKAEEAWAQLTTAQTPYSQDKPHILYIEADGAALNTRTKDENESTWRENKLGVVYSTDNIHFWNNRQGERMHKICKREYVSYIGSVNEFKKLLYSTALRNGYGAYKTTVFISDGAAWIKNMAEELFPDAQHILDYYHLCENVYDYAKAIYDYDEGKYRPWSERILGLLRNSQWIEALELIKLTANIAAKKRTVCLYDYISNNIGRIDYKAYVAKGFFIGSGAVESGNKTVLQQRCKQAGMRWNVETAQNMLSLRSKLESELWSTDVKDVVHRVMNS